MKGTYTLTKEDYWNLQKHIHYNTFKSKVELALRCFLFTLAMIPFYLLTHSIIKAVAIPIITMLFTLYLRYPHAKRMVYKNAENRYGILDEKTIEIKEDGISLVTNCDNEFYKWIAINSIEMTDKYIYIFFERLAAIILPKRIFNSKDEAIQFYNTANMFMGKAKQNN